MKTVQFNVAGNAAEVLLYTEHQKPDISSDSVLVKVMARPLNPSDFMFIQGQYRIKPQYPQIAGLEGSGIIAFVGESVEGFQQGDHVAFRGVGTWAKYISLKPESLIRVARDIPFQQSAQLALNPVTSFALLELSALNPGDFILLSAAASALSVVIIQLAMQKGIKVIGLVRDTSQKETLLKLGVIAVLDQNDPELTNTISKITGGTEITAFLDAVGGQLLSKCIKVMHPGGTIILYGRFDPTPAELYNGDVIYRNLIIKGFGIAQWLSEQSQMKMKQIFQFLVDSIADKKLILPEPILYKLEDFKQAIEEDMHKKSGKVVLIN